MVFPCDVDHSMSKYGKVPIYDPAAVGHFKIVSETTGWKQRFHTHKYFKAVFDTDNYILEHNASSSLRMSPVEDLTHI